MTESTQQLLARVSEILARAEKATPDNQARFLYRMVKSAKQHAKEDRLFYAESSPEQDWADCELWAAARSDIPALCHAVQELAERNRWLTAQLQRIGINKDGIYCDCNHDDENCCERIGEFCPTCIAAVALITSPPQEAQEKP